jgi:lipopolysaccharide transport protein LptA/LPS export ABC transporter protein LptC
LAPSPNGLDMLRLRLISAGKLAALGVFVLIGGALVGYLTLRLKPAPTSPGRPKLQGRVVAVFNNTRYAHEVEGRIRFLVSAGTDKTYEDGTHELEGVRLESYGSDGKRFDVVTSDQAKVTDPSDLVTLDAEFSSNVVVKLTDGLEIRTNYLHYDRNANRVDTPEHVEFNGKKVSGSSTGLLIETEDERVHLLKDADVTIKTVPDSDSTVSAGAVSNSGGPTRKAEQSPEEKAARKARKRQRKLERKRQRALMAAGPPNPTGRLPVHAPGSATTRTKAQPSTKPIRIRSETALLEKKDHRVTFTNKAVATQGSDEMRANRLTGYLDSGDHIERIEARGESYLRQSDRSELKSADMDFFFGETHQLARAVANGDAYARSLSGEPLREARAPTIEATFVDSPEGNAVDSIVGRGGARVLVHAPAPKSETDNPTRRELTATEVTLHFYPDGRYIKEAEAVENAVMTVTPVKAVKGADRKSIRAPRLSADFFETNDQMKSFEATGRVRVEFEALIPEEHALRVTTSDRLTATFLPDSQDVDRLVQEGDFKYEEGDRHALAERAVYDAQKEFLTMRGKRPQAWDAKARTQADEIDYDHAADETHARGDVRSTYYSPETTNDSTPFKNTKSPVFLTADRSDARNDEGIAVYTGNARGWQDDNFVKADRIELYKGDKRMVAIGTVESALYTVKRETKPGQSEIVPAFATAQRMTYSDAERLVHYEGDVKARQGEDRLDADRVDVYLEEESSEVDHMFAEGSVVLTQPGRRGTGDSFSYRSEDGRSVLVGNYARIDDREQGTSTGAQLTFYVRDDRLTVDNQHGTGRVRSTHRLKRTTGSK